MQTTDTVRGLTWGHREMPSDAGGRLPRAQLFQPHSGEARARVWGREAADEKRAHLHVVSVCLGTGGSGVTLTSLLLTNNKYV